MNTELEYFFLFLKFSVCFVLVVSVGKVVQKHWSNADLGQKRHHLVIPLPHSNVSGV